MPRPRYCIQRAPPPSPAALLHEILQWGPHAPIPGERCAGLARRRSRRAHSLSPNLGRTASPIWPDLIYDRHRSGATSADTTGATLKDLIVAPRSLVSRDRMDRSSPWLPSTACRAPCPALQRANVSRLVSIHSIRDFSSSS